MSSPQPAIAPTKPRSWKPALLIFLAAAALVAALDLWSKSWAFERVRLAPEGRFVLWEGRLEFIRAYNTAGMWSVGYGAEQSNTILMVIGSIVVLAVLAWGAWLVKDDHRGSASLAGFILGGAIGNLYDRFAYGGVRDFIQVYLWNGYPYPTFNVADSFLVCSVATLILGPWLFGSSEAKRRSALAT
jgi:signal peptidase II